MSERITTDEWAAELAQKYGEKVPRQGVDHLAYDRWRTEWCRKRGICRECSSPATGGYPLCDDCRRRSVLRTARRIKKRILAGLCPCGSTKAPRMYYCDRCRALRWYGMSKEQKDNKRASSRRFWANRGPAQIAKDRERSRVRNSSAAMKEYKRQWYARKKAERLASERGAA